ncbi:MAG: IS5 family transposase, partial [Thermofilaceae archaeon]
FGRKPKHHPRIILNAIFYLMQVGCPWRYLPADFPPYTTVSYYYHRWRKEGVLQRIHDALRAEVRRAAGRAPEPSVVIVDSQSVACAPHKGGGATPRETAGYDPAKRVKGRKRFVAVDTQGWIWGLEVLPASAHETHGGRWVVAQACVASSRVRQVWADTAYQGSFEEEIAQAWGVEVVIVQRRPPRGFAVLPKRWIVERTFGWLSGARRLARDYECTPQSVMGWIWVRMIQLMVRRLTRRGRRRA